jgi:hypothetical protein
MTAAFLVLRIMNKYLEDCTFPFIRISKTTIFTFF